MIFIRLYYIMSCFDQNCMKFLLFTLFFVGFWVSAQKSLGGHECAGDAPIFPSLL